MNDAMMTIVFSQLEPVKRYTKPFLCSNCTSAFADRISRGGGGGEGEGFNKVLPRAVQQLINKNLKIRPRADEKFDKRDLERTKSSKNET